MAHAELDLRKRCSIEDMLNEKVPVSQIAAHLRRHRSTVYREIECNGSVDEELPQLYGDYGLRAQRKATVRRAGLRKLVRQEELRAAVITQLKEGW